MLILIPAYEPDLRLLTLLGQLGQTLPDARVLVVDDGSGPDYDGIFSAARELGAHVVRHVTNRGKGHALRAGLRWARTHAPQETIVCADCDGQHTPTDIARVAQAVRPATIVLGGRRFTGRVPLRSRVGNTATRWLFRALTSQGIHDTQTGLRGFAPDVVAWLLTVDGDRFEYEYNVLLRARQAGVTLHEIPIETIYLDDNASSHFRPLRDSARIAAPMLGFAASSLAGAAVDIVALAGWYAASGSVVASVVGARLLSATTNFLLNREFVFRHDGDRRLAAARYAGLAVAILALNALGMWALVDLAGLPLLVAKVLVEAVLFGLSYVAQHRFVFAPPAMPARPDKARELVGA